MTDSELLEQFHAGSQAAFGELVQRHLGWVHASALRRTGDPHMADDVAQAVFIALAQSKRVPKGAAMSAWMFRVVQYASANLLRSERRRDRHEREAARQAARGEQAPSDQREALNQYLDRAVECLGKPDLHAVVLRYYEQKSVADVGAALGISEEGAKKRLTRAIAKLRAILARDGIIIPANALGAALQGATAPSPASATAPTAQAISQPSVRASQTTKAAALARAATNSIGSASVKFAIAGAIAAMVLVPTTAVLVVVSRASSQSAAGPAPAPAAAPASTSPAGLSINDRLKVTIREIAGPGSTSVYTPLIDLDGTIAMPLIAPIQVRGLSPAEIEGKIRKAYWDANLIAAAKLKVERIEDGNHPLTGRGVLKAGDSVVCHITDLEGPNIESRLPRTIAADGGIDMPHLGSVQIAGKSESAAAVQIAGAYFKANLLAKAVVELVRQLPPSVSLAPAADLHTAAPLPTVAPPSAGSLDLWETVRTNREAKEQAIHCFDVHFTHTLYFPASDGSADAGGEVEQIHLIQSNGKYFEESTARLTGRLAKPSTTAEHRAMGFDGRTGWFRRNRDVDTVTYGTSDRFRRVSPFNPLNFMVEPTRYLQKRLDSGAIRLVSASPAEQANKAVINIQFASRGGARLSFSFSVGDGYLPVDESEETPEGRLLGERTVDEIEPVRGVGGETVFFPIRAHRQVLSALAKVPNTVETLQVDPDSLRVNVEIPEGTFALSPLPGEKILNGDTGKFVSIAEITRPHASTTGP